MDVAGWHVGVDEGPSESPYVPSCDPSEFVPLVFAISIDWAERYRSALEQRGIPTLVESDHHKFSLGLLMRRVPLLVPEEMQDEASEIVARLEQLESEGDGDDEYFDEDDEELLEDDDFDDADDEDDLIDDEDEF